MILPLVLGLVLAAPPQDSARKLTKRARNAEASYERVSRTRAPTTLGYAGSRCDEVVGRFCLTFDPDEFKRHIPPMPPVVGEARADAIAALERAAAAAPADSVTARSLVRLLVEAHRDTAALAAAQRYAAAAGGPWGELLQGFALHALGDDTGAMPRFRRAFTQLPERERKRLSPEDLVSHEEGSAYRKLSDSARARYEAALWKLADPLYLTPGNEVLGEHYARYVWGRMLAEVRPVAGMVSWGNDLEELTFRYGVPQSRERVPARTWEVYDNYVEHFDSTQRAFLPESLLTVGVREAPPPGIGSTMYDPWARSGYSPPRGVRAATTLPLNITRFPVRDSVVLRIDGALPVDSAARPAERVRAGLFVLRGLRDLLRGDTAVVRWDTASLVPRRDTARFTFFMTLPAGAYIYSVEAVEPVSGQAARARFAIPLLPALASGVRKRLNLSDILLAHPLTGTRPSGRRAPELHALDEAVLLAGDTLGLYAEVSGIDTTGGGRYRVELELTRAGRTPSGVVGWLRRGLGGGPPGRAVRLSWADELPTGPAGVPLAPPPGASTMISTDLVLPARLSPGLYELTLRVTKPGSEPAVATRLLRVRKR